MTIIDDDISPFGPVSRGLWAVGCGGKTYSHQSYRLFIEGFW
jgi:hypothetical protein